MFDRRNFMKFAGGAVAGTLATPVIWKTLDDISIWSQNWSWIPRLQKGENAYVRTASKLCPSACGLNVRLVGGRPVRALGDALSPLSRGGLSPLAAAEVQLLYSPARLRRPMKRGADGGYTAVTWEEAEKLLAEKLSAARRSRKILCVSGDENGSINDVLSAVVTACGSDDFYLMPGDAQTVASAWDLMGGTGRIGYDFAKSDFVLAVGANVLENWGPVVANRRAWGEARPAASKPSMRLAYAGPVQNGTAAGSDMWLPVRPNAEAAFLLGLVNVLASVGSVPPALSALKSLAAEWTPDRAAKLAGVSADDIVKLAGELRTARAPLVIVGSESGQGCATAPVLLGICINMLLGNVNRDGGMRILPVASSAVSGGFTYAAMMKRNLIGVAAEIAAGTKEAPELLMVYEANPVYSMPSSDMLSLIEKAGFSVAFSCFFDETAAKCDLVLPAAMGLERFDDIAVQYGVGEAMYTLVKPVIKPLFSAKQAGDVLLGCAAKAGINFGYTSYVQVLKNKAMRCGASWDELMKGNTYATRKIAEVPSTFAIPVQALSEAVKTVSDALKDGALAVATVTRLAFGTAGSGLPPFATKLVLHDIAGKALTASMNRATMRAKGIAAGSLITLSADNGKVLAKVAQDEGVAMDTVALAAGFGHTDFDEFNDGKGANVMLLGRTVKEPGTGFDYWNCSDVTVAKA